MCDRRERPRALRLRPRVLILTLALITDCGRQCLSLNHCLQQCYRASCCLYACMQGPALCMYTLGPLESKASHNWSRLINTLHCSNSCRGQKGAR